MNQSFSPTSSLVSKIADIGDQVRVWLRSTGEQVRPQIVEGTLRRVIDTDLVQRLHTDVDILSIIVITDKGEYRKLNRSIIGSIERVD